MTLRARATELEPTTSPGQAFRTLLAAPGERLHRLSPNGESVRPPYQVTVLRTASATCVRRGVGLRDADDQGRRPAHAARDVTRQTGRGAADRASARRRRRDASPASLRLRDRRSLRARALAHDRQLGRGEGAFACSPTSARRRGRRAHARFSVRLDTKGDDELARLGAAFNEMLEGSTVRSPRSGGWSPTRRTSSARRSRASARTRSSSSADACERRSRTPSRARSSTRWTSSTASSPTSSSLRSTARRLRGSRTCGWTSS